MNIADIAQRVGPSVVGLGSGARGGSGVVVAPGRVLTLARNVTGDAVEVHLGGGEAVPGRVVGRDVGVDAAVVAIEADVAPVAWAADDGAVGIGTPVAALGDPAGRGLRVTPGVVASAPRGVRGPRGRLIEGVLEHTAPLPRGSGGGPLVDATGRLLGLNAVRRPGGLILAWPAGVLRPAAEALASGAHRPPRQLGVAVAPPAVARRLRGAVGLPEADGLLVRGVRDGSAADRAGLARGDLIVEAAGRPVAAIDDLYVVLDAAAPGAAVALGVLRGAERRELTATLEEPS
jgi:S1-C subfamily serine protease